MQTFLNPTGRQETIKLQVKDAGDGAKHGEVEFSVIEVEPIM